MSEFRFFARSLLTSAAAAIVLTLAIPAAPTGGQQACGRVAGDDCASVCTRECSGGTSCCEWAHYNYIEPE